MSRVRVLHLITELDVGGAETAMALVASGCKARGIDVEAASLRGPGPIGERLAREGIPVHAIGMRGAWDVGAIGRVRRLIEERRPDVLHTHLFHATLIGRLAVRGGALQRTDSGVCVRPRVVSTIQVCERERRWHPLLDGLTQDGSDVIVCVSEAVRQWAIRAGGIAAWRCRVIPNPVVIPDRPACLPPSSGAASGTDSATPGRRSDAPPALGSQMSACDRGALREAIHVPSAAPLVLTLGRLHRQKGIDLLIKAIPDVRRRIPDVFFAVAGDGPERAALARLADRWGVSPAIRWLGWRADAAHLLAAADLFCLPSRWEGLPLSILEAFARGVPVVATTVDGNEELLRGGETGWPAPPEDPIGLAGAIVEALKRREEATARAGRARDLVERKYTADRCVGEHVELYRSLRSAD